MRFEKIPESSFILKIEMNEKEATEIQKDLKSGFKGLYLNDATINLLNKFDEII